MKKYLITGFSGFVSFYFLQFLNDTVAKNEEIEILGIDKALPMNYEADYKFPNIHINFISLNLMDLSSLMSAIKSFTPDYILHLAAFSNVGMSWRDPIGCFVNNTNIFLNLIEAVRRINRRCRILSVGSSEEYGNVSDSDIPLSEEMELKPTSPYAIARVSQEMLSRCYVESMGLDIVLTRSFNHIGPRQKETFVVPSFISQILKGKASGLNSVEVSVGNLEITRDFLDVRDVVRAYHLLFIKGKSGNLYNVCSGIGYKLQYILDLIAKIVGCSVMPVVDKDKIRPADSIVIVGNNMKLCKEIGWSPKFSLKQTLEDMVCYNARKRY